jgi:SAM-dependent methyltransferase
LDVGELREHYDRWHADGAEPAVSAATEERRFHDWVLRLLAAPSGSTLLDVACGAGAFAAHASARGLRVTGVDVSDVAIEAARAAVPDAELVVADCQELPFEDARFDRVTCLGSLEHFPDPARGAAEMRRVLRPGGIAVIFVPNLFFLGHLYFGLRHGTQPTEGGQRFSEAFRTSGGWRDLLEEAGLEVRDVRPWNRIHASQRVPPPVKRLWNAGSRFVPLNVSYAFGFVCSR